MYLFLCMINKSIFHSVVLNFYTSKPIFDILCSIFDSYEFQIVTDNKYPWKLLFEFQMTNNIEYFFENIEQEKLAFILSKGVTLTHSSISLNGF